MARWSQVRQALSGALRVGLDLEGDFNLHRYGRRICLFQISLDDGQVFLLDPLGGDLESDSEWAEWKDFLENPAVTKVIWAAQNDVRALKTCHGIHLAGLFDLFDAARMTSFPKPSLPLLAQRLLGIELTKDEKWQTSDWNRRPLAEEQKRYAALDVQYLLPLADALAPLLVEKRQIGGFENRMRAVESYVFEVSATPWLKMKGSGALRPREQLRLKDLWIAREDEARRLDKAPWKILSNEVLLEQARATQD
jgi:ribonuclease D